MCGQTGRQAGKQADRQTDRPADRQTDRPAHLYDYSNSSFAAYCNRGLIKDSLPSNRRSVRTRLGQATLVHCLYVDLLTSVALQSQPGELDVGRPQPLKELAQDFRHLGYWRVFILTSSVVSVACVEVWLKSPGWKSPAMPVRAEQRLRPILPAVSVRPHASDSQEERRMKRSFSSADAKKRSSNSPRTT